MADSGIIVSLYLVISFHSYAFTKSTTALQTEYSYPTNCNKKNRVIISVKYVVTKNHQACEPRNQQSACYVCDVDWPCHCLHILLLASCHQGPNVQHFIFFLTYDGLNKLECLLLTGLFSLV
jgi:hypothetical protein